MIQMGQRFQSVALPSGWRVHKVRCLLCGGTIVKRGPSLADSGADVYFCSTCPNVYRFTRGHEVEALERRARETGLADLGPPAPGRRPHGLSSAAR